MSSRKKRVEVERPTEAEIRELCVRIQAKWSENERQRRSHDKPKSWSVPRYEGDVKEIEGTPW